MGLNIDDGINLCFNFFYYFSVLILLYGSFVALIFEVKFGKILIVDALGTTISIQVE